MSERALARTERSSSVEGGSSGGPVAGGLSEGVLGLAGNRRQGSGALRTKLVIGLIVLVFLWTWE